jgi:hypothetical protein
MKMMTDPKRGWPDADQEPLPIPATHNCQPQTAGHDDRQYFGRSSTSAGGYPGAHNPA